MQGSIIKSLSGTFYVLETNNNKVYPCKAKGDFRSKKIIPICGDKVEFDFDEKANFALITKILPRKNQLVRPPIANIDLGLIVMSTIKPNFDSFLVDKMIIALTMQNIEPIILVSKCEFLSAENQELLDNYQQANYQVIPFSSHENINIDKIKTIIANKRVVLCGQSGVGKSSLINALLQENQREVGSFSEKLGRGRHQTKEVEFININDALVADSPGFSRLDLNIDVSSMPRIFKDFEKLAHNCKYATCMHINEQDCAVKKALENKLIAPKRYENYLHIIKELKEGKQVWRKK